MIYTAKLFEYPRVYILYNGYRLMNVWMGLRFLCAYKSTIRMEIIKRLINITRNNMNRPMFGAVGCVKRCAVSVVISYSVLEAC